jgi:RNA polymerase sigma factor for flagellar operon FliA
VAQPADSPEVMNRFNGALDLVSIIAGQLRKCVGTIVEREDLLSYGKVGLLDASRRFDSERGVPFRAYATLRIRGAIIYERLRGVEASDRVNEGVLDDAHSPGASQMSSESADQTLADHLAGLATAMAIGMVATPVRGDDERLTALSHEQSPEDVASEAELRKTVQRALEGLPYQEAELVRRHYFDGERFDVVAAELGLSKSWASRLHAKALMRLSKRLRSAGVEP